MQTRVESTAARPAQTGSGEERAKRFTMILLGLQRLSYLLPAMLAQLGADRLALSGVLFGATLAWNVTIFWLATRHGWFARWVAWVDVVLASVLFTAVPTSLGADHAEGALNWSGRVGQAAAALAGAVLAPRHAVAAMAVLLGVHGGATYGRMHDSPELVPELITCLNGLVWFALIIGFGHRYLTRQGRRLDELSVERTRSHAREAANHAHHAARLAHHRALHDTVLATLTAIARGVDATTDQIRRRCARDADFVRRLLQEDMAPDRSVLHDRFAEAIADAEAVGLRVNYRCDALPDLPQDVVDAIGDATREALNNVARHAGVPFAWLTATTERGAVTVRVVDRGRGFDTAAAVPGFGLRWSIVDRMAGVGGTAQVSSMPGDGTCVELTWSL